MIEAIKAIDGYAEMTAADILAELQANDVTHRPVPVGDLLFLMRNRGMLIKLIRPADNGEQWTGTFADLMFYVHEHGGPELQGAISLFFSHITDTRSISLDLTDLEYAIPFRQMAEGFGGQTGMPSVEDFDAIAGLGGGWKHAKLTAEDITAAITRDAMAAWWTAQEAVVSEGIHAGTITTQAEAVAAIVVSE